MFRQEYPTLMGHPARLGEHLMLWLVVAGVLAIGLGALWCLVSLIITVLTWASHYEPWQGAAFIVASAVFVFACRYQFNRLRDD